MDGIWTRLIYSYVVPGIRLHAIWFLCVCRNIFFLLLFFFPVLFPVRFYRLVISRWARIWKMFYTFAGFYHYILYSFSLVAFNSGRKKLGYFIVRPLFRIIAIVISAIILLKCTDVVEGLLIFFNAFCAEKKIIKLTR